MARDLEYQTLRQEILEEQGREISIINLSVTATAALVGFGFTVADKQSLIFLAPLAVLAMALLQLNNILYSALTKAVYIRIAIESQKILDLKWENFINLYRNKLRGEKKASHLIFDASPYMMIAIAMGFFCVILAFYFSRHQYQAVVSAISGVLWICFSYYIISRLQYAISGSYEKDLEKTTECLLTTIERQRAANSDGGDVPPV